MCIEKEDEEMRVEKYDGLSVRLVLWGFKTLRDILLAGMRRGRCILLRDFSSAE